MLEPESRALLDTILPRYAPAPETPPEEARRLALELGRRLQGEPPPVPVSGHAVPAGSHSIPIRLYRPPENTGGWLLWIHGGGWVTGGLATHDTLCRRLAVLSGQAVVSLDYRLAPEHPFPAALDDCETVLGWLFSNAKRLDLDPARCAIGGSSAGGNLAAALALRNRDGDRLPIRHQVLVYPCLDATLSAGSMTRHANGYQLTAAMMEHYVDLYAGSADRRDPFLSPLLAENLAGLPPADIVIAELDPIADDGIAFAKALSAAGVSVRVTVYDGVMHGFFAQAGVLSLARAAQEQLCDSLRHALG